MLPFGNATVIETLTYAQLVAAFVNGFKPPCGDVAGGTGRTPQFSGLKVDVPLHRQRAGDRLDRCVCATTRRSLRPTTVRIVTNDFMFNGGDGYTALTGGTDVHSSRAICCSTWRSST